MTLQLSFGKNNLFSWNLLSKKDIVIVAIKIDDQLEQLPYIAFVCLVGFYVL
jgi:hypothetical protein